MEQMDALAAYWADEDAVIVPAGDPAATIRWLAGQDPDTWHKVVCSWNYDHDGVLPWILSQRRCDRGTAAEAFRVAGHAHWLWDVLAGQHVPNHSDQVCETVLENWTRYETGEIRPRTPIDRVMLGAVRKGDRKGLLSSTPVEDILTYEGERDAVSRYAAEDGKIVVDFDRWLEERGITIER